MTIKSEKALLRKEISREQEGNLIQKQEAENIKYIFNARININIKYNQYKAKFSHDTKFLLT